MADDLTTQSAAPSTPPAATVFATKDIAGKHYIPQLIVDPTTPSQRLGVDSGGRITVRLSDGTDVLLVNADGSIGVRLSDGTDALGINSDGSVFVRLSDGTDTLLINGDGSLTAALVAGSKIKVTDGTDDLAVNSDGSLVVRLSDGTDTALVDATGHLLVAGSLTTTPAKGTPLVTANAPGAAAAICLAANANRISAVIQNVGAVDVYVGPVGVLTTTGILLEQGASLVDNNATAAWYAITGGSAGALRLLEVA